MLSTSVPYKASGLAKKVYEPTIIGPIKSTVRPAIWERGK